MHPPHYEGCTFYVLHAERCAVGVSRPCMSLRRLQLFVYVQHVHDAEVQWPTVDYRTKERTCYYDTSYPIVTPRQAVAATVSEFANTCVYFDELIYKIGSYYIYYIVLNQHV